MPYRISVEGLDASFLSLSQLSPVLADIAFEEGLLAASRVWARTARANPLFQDRTGRLRRSIRGRRGRSRYKPSALITFAAPNRGSWAYGFVLEHTGFPTLATALQTGQDEMQRAFAEGVRGEERKVEQELRSRTRSGARSRTLRALSGSGVL